jgi:CDP-diacylglycerol--serine O-phosphatidyltransferase
MKKHVPNLITSLNVISGTAAIFMIARGDLAPAVTLVLLAMVFDFFDGLVARLLHVKSELGKELDSLADVVSFGVAPAMLAHALIRDALPETGWLIFLPVIMPAFSAYRLAKFNLDTRQASSFIGMPTPAHALFWVALWFARQHTPALYDACWGSPWVLAGCVVLFSVLLVSGLPMFSLKIASFAWEANRWRYLYFAAALLSLLFFREGAISFLIPLYVFFSVLSALPGKWCARP